MTPRYRAAVFDLDGTLLDSMPLVLRAFEHAVAPWERWHDREQMRRLITAPPRECLRRLLHGDEQHLDEAWQRLLDYSHTHVNDIRPFVGANELLAELRRAGVRTGVWTSRDRMSATGLVRTWGIDALVEEMVCGDDLPTHKPDPEGLGVVCTRLGVGLHEAVYAGDAEVDVQAGHALGVATVLVLQGFRIPDEVRALAVHAGATPLEAYAWIAAHCGAGTPG
jgi:HAD superfamily hydrolase (TIGR01509 family)